MTAEIDKWINHLDAADKKLRLDALRMLRREIDAGSINRPAVGRDVNNHIHTTCSFSPYTPAAAVWQAWNAGLVTAGIMDHDTLAGANEFLESGRIIGLPVTIGAECRVSFAGTELAGRRLNNPDQKGLAYVALHGIPEPKIEALTDFFYPVRQKRLQRSRAMTERLNKITAPLDLDIDFSQDIIPLSQWEEGGEITERHILFALARKMLSRYKDRARLISLLRSELDLEILERAEKNILDQNNPFREYDLLGVLKSRLVEQFYIDAEDECPQVEEMANFCAANGIILAYAYLGDVTESVTGDKKAQKFEDSFLEELFAVLRKTGFQAVTYMPSRNSMSQLIRLKKLCDKFGFFQISGEDINQPRQKFICQTMRDPFFANLYDSAWALIGHEKLSARSMDNGMFSAETKHKYPDLNQRIRYYCQAGKQLWRNS